MTKTKTRKLLKTSFYIAWLWYDGFWKIERQQVVMFFCCCWCCLPKIITKVIFIVFTFALGMSPRELVRLFSASSRAILWRLASVSGTETSTFVASKLKTSKYNNFQWVVEILSILWRCLLPIIYMMLERCLMCEWQCYYCLWRILRMWLWAGWLQAAGWTLDAVMLYNERQPDGWRGQSWVLALMSRA